MKTTRIKNLDVVGTSHDRVIGRVKGIQGALAPIPHLSSLGAYTAQPSGQREHRRRYRAGGTKFITVLQATNIIEAIAFSKSIGLPLVAHLTIHWSLTDAGDDPNGTLFAKVREGLDKYLRRRGIAFPAAWARERQSGGQSDVVHCHLLFHLPVEYRTGTRLLQVKAAIFRLINRHGRGYGCINQCLLCARKQTFSNAISMSAKCQNRTIPCLPLATARDELGLLPLRSIRLGQDQRLSALHSFKQVTSKEHQIAQQQATVSSHSGSNRIKNQWVGNIGSLILAK